MKPVGAMLRERGRPAPRFPALPRLPHLQRLPRRPLGAAILLATLVAPALEAQRPLEVVEQLTAPFVDDVPRFAYRVAGSLTGGPDLTEPRVDGASLAGGRRDDVEVRFARTGAADFALEVRSEWATFTLSRTAFRTELRLPDRRVTFVGRGPLAPDDDSLMPDGFVDRVLDHRLGLLAAGRALLLARARELGEDGRLDNETSISIPDGQTIAIRSRQGLGLGIHRLEVRREPVSPADSPAAPAVRDPTTEVVEVDRAELERMVFRATRRLVETWVPGAEPRGRRAPARVDGGELRYVEGQRLVLLRGDPVRIGKAHGELLSELVRRTVDSSLYLVGLVATIQAGAWFPAVLEGAFARLAPHVPQRHLDELDALADAVDGLSRRELRLANVFPEYFHCSGFAVFGKATAGGKLYHGRVLDYMTMIGLQHAATTFVVVPRRGYAFLNVGYAGFVGSVTGMNERQISLGELGGGGRGRWDGVPMATLMRRGLEECATLESVQDLWRESPRTCEYFYVFADGKRRTAVGVTATPDELSFLLPGQAHERLGAGIEDAIVLSAGDRLAELKRRIRARYGAIDTEAAIRLMDRPVAMQSNLHDALMIPEDGVVHVAQASRSRPAAETRYVRFDLRALLAELDRAGTERTFPARDTLDPGRRREDDPAAKAMLAALGWAPEPFDVDVHWRGPGNGDGDGDWRALVSFPSPKPRRTSEGAGDDLVFLEWYEARGKNVAPAAPAMIVLHILDGRMRVARTIARGLANNGIHAFVMHMPGYGRRGTDRDRRDVAAWLARSEQAAGDARRARDAVEALPGVDPGAIGIQGTSLGGFIAALAASLDGTFDRTFLMLAGGDLDAMMKNGVKDTAKIRRSLLQAGMTDEDIARALHRIDPVRLAHRLDPQRTWLLSAENDLVVPRANAEALGRAAHLDEDHHLFVQGGHYTAVVHLPGILRFMVERVR